MKEQSASANDDLTPPTAAELDEVERLDAVRLGPRAGEREGTEAFVALQRLGIDLLPRLARAYRAFAGRELKAYRKGRADGRREAIEEANKVAREWTSTRDADIMAELLNAWLARGSK